VADNRDWKMQWLRELVTASLAVAIVGVTLWLLVAHFYSVTPRTVAAEDIANPALAVARQLAAQQAFEDRQTVLGVAIGLIGVVTGYFFGRVPVESRAQKAEQAANKSSEAAASATTERLEAEKTKEAAERKIDDVRATLGRMTDTGGLLSASSAKSSVELTALKQRIG
jgi:hypothetical protein